MQDRDGVRAAEFARRRQALGMTQAQLAAALDVSRRTIVRWETGEQPIPRPFQIDSALSALEREEATTTA